MKYVEKSLSLLRECEDSLTRNLAIWFFLVAYFFFLMDVSFVWSRVTIGQCLYKMFLHERLPFQLPLIVYLGAHIRSDLWQKIFSWKALVIPTSIMLLVSVFVWQFNPEYLYQTSLLGFKWNWIAVSQWLLLFILQLYLYQKSGIGNFISFLLSYLGVFLGSFLYEVPFFLKSGGLYLDFMIIYVFSFMVFAWILFKEKAPLRLRHFVFLLPLVPIWIFYFDLPMWIHRLSVFPYFLLLPIVKSWKT